MADDARVQQYQCNGGANQHWIVADAPGGNYRIVARHSGKVMDVAGGATADNTLVSQVTWKSGPNQQFKLVMVPGSDVPAPAAKAGAGGAEGKDAKVAKGAKKAKSAAAPAAAKP